MTLSKFRNILLPAVFCLFSLKLFARQDKVIYIPLNAEKQVVESARDMAYWLERAGAGQYVVETTQSTTSTGIRIIAIEKSDLPVSLREQMLANGQSFHLYSIGPGNAIITGTGSNSYINGIYTYLHELGFRWYMPGDNWVKLGDVSKKIQINKVYSPDFRDRSYAGSGGANPIPGIDETNTFRADFGVWNRRNRLSVDYPVKGHSGVAFFDANRQTMMAHPEYFCYNKISRSPRLNFDNKDVVKLFVSWALSQRKENDRFPLIGVDPADGSGSATDCLPTTIPGIKTWSDKYFWMANQVAEALSPADTKIRVSMYAYNMYADPPSFDLHKNVYPIIIPYAFQEVAEPTDFIRLWAEKMNGRPMGIYDYWNITQWDKCLPRFNFYAIPIRLRYWKASKITSINLESTFSKGSMGHTYWLAAQMMWDTGVDFETIFNEFLTNCFGAGAVDIRRMYDRWSSNYQGAAEPILSDDDLAKASSKVKDPAILNRIAEIKAYVHYIRLYENYVSGKTAARYDELINYILSIHSLRMLHTSALVTLYIPKPLGYKAITDAKLQAALNQKIRPLKYEDIEKQFANDRKADAAVYTMSSLKYDFSKLIPAKSSRAIVAPQKLNATNKYSFYIKQSSTITFEVGSTKSINFTIRDEKESVIFQKKIEASTTGTSSIKVKLGAGSYTLQWGAVRCFSRIRFPANIVFVSKDKQYDNAGYPLQYVYIPSDVSQVVYQDILGPGINKRGYWLDPDGKKVNAEKIAGDIYRIDVPAEQRGKVWILNIGHRQFRMLNIPEQYSLNPFTYKE